MNKQLIRILELAESNAIIDVEQRYHTNGETITLEQVDSDALNQCLDKEWVEYDVDEVFEAVGPSVACGTITRLALTSGGRMTLYEHRHAAPVPEPEAATASQSAVQTDSPAAKQGVKQPTKGRGGRPRENEKGSATKVIAALCKHHGYDN